MRKPKRKQKGNNNAAVMPLSRDELLLRRIHIIEDVILATIMMATLWLFTTALNSHFTLPKLALVSLLTALLQISFFVRLRLNAYNYIPKPIWMPLAGLIIWWLISTTQAIHLQTALEGQYGRYNALYTNLLLVILFINLASMPLSIARVKRILLVLLVLLLPVCLYAFAQYLGLDQVFNMKAGARPPSSIGNPVALATVLLMYFPFAAVFASYPEAVRQKISYIVILLFLITTILITGSRGPWLGSAVAITVLILLGFFINRDIGKFFNYRSLIIAVVCLGLFALLLNMDSIQQRFSLGQGFDIRLMYYEVAWEAFKDSPIFGFGFESFRLIYPDYRPEFDWQALITKNTTPTMIHNDYLQLLVDNGLPSLLLYLTLISSILWYLFIAFRRGTTDRRLLIAMLAAIIGYLAQANLGWLEAASSIMYWILLGLSAGFVTHTTMPTSAKTLSTPYHYSLSIVVTLSFFISLSYASMMLGKVTDDYALRKAQQNSVFNFKLSKQYIADIDASRHNNFYYQEQLGLLYIHHLRRQANPDNYLKARRHLFRSAELNPYDAYVRFHIIENDIIAIRKQLIRKPSVEAILAAEEIIKIDPNNPSTHRVAARLYRVLGNDKKQAAHVKRMKELENYDWKGVDQRKHIF